MGLGPGLAKSWPRRHDGRSDLPGKQSPPTAAMRIYAAGFSAAGGASGTASPGIGSAENIF